MKTPYPETDGDIKTGSASNITKEFYLDKIQKYEIDKSLLNIGIIKKTRKIQINKFKRSYCKYEFKSNFSKSRYVI